MRPPVKVLLFCLGLLAIDCAPGDAVLVVRLEASGPITGATLAKPRVTVAGLGMMALKPLPITEQVTGQTFAVVFPSNRVGDVVVTVAVTDGQDNELSKGEGMIRVRPSQRSDLTILLGSAMPPDLSMPDLPMPDLARPDLTVIDLRMPMPPDLFFCKSDNDCAPRYCDPMTGRCAACQPTGSPNKGCAMGFSCVKPANDWLCEMGCAADADCKMAPKTTCCNKVCVDVTADSKHCNGCGKACPGEQLCCKSSCKDQAIDLDNCGGCGVTCVTPNATPQCKNKTCIIAACKAPFDNCDGDVKNGCEADLNNSVPHCGMCDKLCMVANGLPVCALGKCTVGVCVDPLANCNKMDDDGCEANLATDPMNCGTCGKVCSLPNVMTHTCAKKVCGLMDCKQGFADCNGMAGDGCEINSQTDVANCGGCTMKCTLANATARCAVGLCAIDTCNAGFDNCDGKDNTGCELDVKADNANCGKCNMKCAQFETCKVGKCEKDKVLIVGAAQKAYLDDVKKTLDGTGAFATVDTFDAGAATPTALQLAPYAAALVFSDALFFDADMLGNRLADYYDAGGRVVLAVAANADRAVGGRFGDSAGAYALITPSLAVNSLASSAPPFDKPNSPLVKDALVGLTATQARRCPGMVLNSGEIVAKWSTGQPLIVAGTIKGRARADLNFFPVSSAVDNRFWNGDGDKLLRNALLYR